MRTVILVIVVIVGLLLILDCEAAKKVKPHKLQKEVEVQQQEESEASSEKKQKNVIDGSIIDEKLFDKNVLEQLKKVLKQELKNGKKKPLTGANNDENTATIVLDGGEAEESKRLAKLIVAGQSNQKIFCFADFDGLCIGTGKSIVKQSTLKSHNISNIVVLGATDSLSIEQQLKGIHYEFISAGGLDDTGQRSVLCDALHFRSLMKSGKLSPLGDTLLYHAWNFEHVKETGVGEQLLKDATISISDFTEPLFKVKKSMMDGSGKGGKALQWSEDIKTIDADRTGKWVTKCNLFGLKKSQ